MKKLFSLLLALCMLMSCTAFASEDTPVITVNGEGMNEITVYIAVQRHLAISAIQCAGYGYEFDIVDPLNIEDVMDKEVFDLELTAVINQHAREAGITLTEEEEALTVEMADEAWQRLRDVLFDENAMAFLPAGYFDPTGDPDADALAYLEGFFIDADSLIEDARNELTERKLFAHVCPGMDYDSEEGINQWSDIICGWYDEAQITEDKDALAWIAAGFLVMESDED